MVLLLFLLLLLLMTLAILLINVHIAEYLCIDQQVKSWIFATLFRDVFVDVHDLHTSVGS